MLERYTLAYERGIEAGALGFKEYAALYDQQQELDAYFETLAADQISSLTNLDANQQLRYGALKERLSSASGKATNYPRPFFPW